MATPSVLRALLLTKSKHAKLVICQTTRSMYLGKLFRTARLQSLNQEPLRWSSTSGSWSARSRQMEEMGREKHQHHGEGPPWSGAVLGALAFSFFQSTEEDTRSEAQKSEDEIIMLLKKAKLSMYRGQLPAASGLLHQAVALAHKSSNTQAIIYTYSLMANLAYVQGQLDKSEKLFKATMSYMLSGGTPENDNGIIEISLKLATIYAGQNKTELAEHGYRFCTESLEAKLEQHKDSSPDDQSSTDQSDTDQSEGLRKETRLLLGLCLDSRARYCAATRRLKQATQDYRRALQICSEEQGETHPQTLVLMSDLATILDLQGLHAEALPVVRRAVALGRQAGHPDQHVLLGNLAGVLLHQGDMQAALDLYKEALSLARAAGDEEAVEQIQEGLMEVKKRREEQLKETEEEEELDLK
ncbi:tetratricopeptide repeat protein 19, mitochondrial isoform X2 [Gadus macrocephalus]|uniref:tetratricopeptide repeat protein 19, mitochondrial isoform X2 n=1 Tax=Gadus macrocephalus TaxID=80720 RepID=UPI0028CB63F2|nr:tetratricopeptide repeat protein 19, mitochondrial isoform X2 [Gadus macrocephalus]